MSGTFGNATGVGWQNPDLAGYSPTDLLSSSLLSRGYTISSCGQCWDGGCTEYLCFQGFFCPVGSISGSERQCGGPGGIERFWPQIVAPY